MDKNDLVYVEIRNREEIIFGGNVESISSLNDTGVFDILPQHANFISLVKDTLTLRSNGGKLKKIEIENGVLRVTRNKVSIFLDVVAKGKQDGVKSAELS